MLHRLKAVASGYGLKLDCPPFGGLDTDGFREIDRSRCNLGLRGCVADAPAIAAAPVAAPPRPAPAAPRRVRERTRLCGNVTTSSIVSLRRQLGNLRRCRPGLPVRRSWSPLVRVALRHLPRRQFGLLPVLDRAVLVDDRAELHARLAQRPHRRARRTADPPLRPGAQ